MCPRVKVVGSVIDLLPVSVDITYKMYTGVPLLVLRRKAVSEKGVKEGFTTVSWLVASRCSMEYIIYIYVFFIFLGSADDANRQNIKHINRMSKLKQKTIAFYDISFRTTLPYAPVLICYPS